MRAVEIRLRKTRRSEPILIGDHHQLVARCDAALQGRNHVIDQSELVVAVDLEIGWLLDQGAVAIDEQKFARVHAAASRSPSETSNCVFSSGVPTVMRRQSARPG